MKYFVLLMLSLTLFCGCILDSDRLCQDSTELILHKGLSEEETENILKDFGFHDIAMSSRIIDNDFTFSFVEGEIDYAVDGSETGLAIPNTSILENKYCHEVDTTLMEELKLFSTPNLINSDCAILIEYMIDGSGNKILNRYSMIKLSKLTPN